ncbi:MAG: helix-turn-helix domain-containing protein [Beijerinckiaceae bacterium]
MKKKIECEVGSGNVFADIGRREGDVHHIKAQLVFKIGRIMKERGFKQIEAAELFGVKQPDISKMLHGNFRQFSVERLMRFLIALGQDVEIVAKPHMDRREAALLVPPRPAIAVERARAAAAEIRAMSKGVTLGGLKVKELVAEGRL